jgi:ABC-type nitrate/sulfonate/bicarbonate transport system permease component
MTTTSLDGDSAAQAVLTGPGEPDGLAPLPSREGRKRSRRLIMTVAQIVVLAIAVAIWWFGAHHLPPGSMATPFQTLVKIGQLSVTAEFWTAIGSTMGTFALALLLCTIIGVPLGLAIGWSRIATQSTRLVFDFLRTIPPIALLPLVLLLYGATFQMAFTLVVLAAIWPILIQSVYAARQGEPLLAEMSRSFRVPRRWFITHVFIPGALPFVMTGLRVGMTICLLLTITAELLGGAPGVGQEIGNAQQFVDIPRMYAYVVISAVLGLILNGLFYALQRYVLRWHASNRKEVK